MQTSGNIRDAVFATYLSFVIEQLRIEIQWQKRHIYIVIVVARYQHNGCVVLLKHIRMF